MMSRAIHPIAGALALITILIFWTTTLLSEIFDSAMTVVTVKTLIPWGFVILIPALMAAGGTGFAAARGRSTHLIYTKRKRMPIIAANGLFFLMPSALFLAIKASTGDFDSAFYAVQAVELVAGAANIILLGLNMRDGLRMGGRLRRNTKER